MTMQALNLLSVILVQHTRFYMRNLTHVQNLMYIHTKSNSHAEHTKSNSHVVLDSDLSAAQEV